MRLCGVLVIYILGIFNKHIRLPSKMNSLFKYKLIVRIENYKPFDLNI